MRYLALLFLLIPRLAFAEMHAMDGWVPPSPGTPNGVAYLTLHSTQDDALVDVHSDCCTAVEMHSSSMTGGVMRMRRLQQVKLPAGKEVAFAPSGNHLMLIGLKQPLADGDKVTLTLRFARAPEQTVTLDVDGHRHPNDHAMHEH